jgi:hypothetical protein
LVKLIKWYRREHPTKSKKPKGLTLECMVAECMDYKETDYSELFVKTLESMANRYGSCTYTGIVPSISDPAIPGNSVSDDIESDAFIQFCSQLKIDSAKARRAINGNDPDEATNLMREVLGDRFPKSPSSSLRSTLSAPAVASSTTFPDRPIIPNKPKGFASVVPR